jgi:hypothetical protein
MAYKTVSELKDSVSGQLQGLNLRNVTNLFVAFERAARQLSTEIDIVESQSRDTINVYDGVYDYLAPTGAFGSNLIDFQKQGSARGLNDYNYKLPISEFDRTKAFLPNGCQLTFEARQGVRIVRIVSASATPKIELDPMTEKTGWTASGSASGLTNDDIIFWQEPGSFRFNLTGASTGEITKTISSVDLTDYVGVGKVFLAIRTPSATNLTSITLKIGSSASAYYTVTATTAFLGSWIANDWVLVPFDLSTATTVGSPTITAIDYCQISIAHAATLSNFYVGELWISRATPYTMISSSAAIFQASGSNPSAVITSQADSINLTDDAYALYEIRSAITVAEQQGGSVANVYVKSLENKLYTVPGSTKLGLLDLYRAKNPSQGINTIQNYYND